MTLSSRMPHRDSMTARGSVRVVTARSDGTLKSTRVQTPPEVLGDWAAHGIRDKYRRPSPLTLYGRNAVGSSQHSPARLVPSEVKLHNAPDRQVKTFEPSKSSTSGISAGNVANEPLHDGVPARERQGRRRLDYSPSSPGDPAPSEKNVQFHIFPVGDQRLKADVLCRSKDKAENCLKWQ